MAQIAERNRAAEVEDARREKSPDAFRTISEVADGLSVPQHVLRFWETRFSQIRPMKRGGGRRYYRPNDVDLLKGIRQLLYGQGYTIRGVQRILKENGTAHVVAIGRGEIHAGHAGCFRKRTEISGHRSSPAVGCCDRPGPAAPGSQPPPQCPRLLSAAVNWGCCVRRWASLPAARKLLNSES